MSVEVRMTKSGRRYDVRLRDPDGRPYARTFRTRKEAEAFEARERADRSRGAWADPRGADRTLAEVAQHWLAANPSKKPTSLAIDELTVRVHLASAIGSRRLGSVTQPDIQGLVNSWCGAAAPRTVRRRYGVLRAIFAYAVQADWLGRTPCRGIKLPAVTGTRRCLLSPDDVAKLVQATVVEYRPMVWLGAALGLRWSEVAGLRVGAIDLLQRKLTVAEVITRDGRGRPVVGTPKSSAGARNIAMPDALVRLLAEHLALRGLTAADADCLVFEAPNGGPLRYSNWRRRVWLPATVAAQCPGAGFHDLRRASATALIIGGVNVRTAQARLGHSDPRLTLSIYAQVVEEADRQAAETVGSQFFSTRPRDERAMDRRQARNSEGRNPR
jgi:integrase